jgi:hypothetical protein
MSEQNEPNPKSAEALQNRVNKALIADGYTLLNGGVDNIIMIRGTKGKKKGDVLMTFEGAKEMVEQLASETTPKEEASND